MPSYSPLRYPGGKRRLVNFMKTVIHENNLLGCQYIEPYAGGASIGLALLFDGYATHIHINDLDRSVYAFGIPHCIKQKNSSGSFRKRLSQ